MDPKKDKTPEELEAERVADEQMRAERGDNFEGDEGGDDDDTKKAEPEPEAKKGPKDVPYGFFKEAKDEIKVEREARIRLEAELAALRAVKAEPAKPAIDIKALRKQSKDAMLEGDVDKSLEIDAQIDAEVDRRNDERIEAKATEKAHAIVTQQSLERVIEEAYEQYPFLDVKSDEANPAAIKAVVEMRDFYIFKGDTPAAALRKAIKKEVPNYVKDEGGDDLARRREAMSLSRGASTALRQPAVATAGKGARATGDSALPDINKLTDEQLAKLPPEEISRLRGDKV